MQAGGSFDTGWSFQLVPMSFFYFVQIQICLFYLLLFILLYLLSILELYGTILSLVVFDFTEYLKLTKSQMQAYN